MTEQIKSRQVKSEWQCPKCTLKPVFSNSQREQAENHMTAVHGVYPEELHEIGLVKESEDQ